MMIFCLLGGVLAAIGVDFGSFLGRPERIFLLGHFGGFLDHLGGIWPHLGVILVVFGAPRRP